MATPTYPCWRSSWLFPGSYYERKTLYTVYTIFTVDYLFSSNHQISFRVLNLLAALMKNRKQRIIIILLVIFAIASYYKDQDKNKQQTTPNTEISSAYKNKQSDIHVKATGKVIKILPDDNEGNRHQRFIVKVENNLTILIAHNIDLAQRAEISAGDVVAFSGEYEWNKKGGVVHWTHHDPRGKHQGGWIEVNGKRVQ